jgi:agmatinase
LYLLPQEECMTDFGGSIKQTREYDFAIFGIPFDEKSSYLKGAAGGPQAIREASTGEAINAWTESGLDLEQEATIVDLGDIDVTGSFRDVFARTEKKIEQILEKEAVPVVLGGDHSLTYPIVKVFAQKHTRLDILHFDAHPDLYEELYGDRYSHACPFARIIEEGYAANLVQVGIRAATGPHRVLARKHGVRMIEMRDIAQAKGLDFSHPLYVSFDLDVLDPAFAPGVSHHEPGGLSTRQALDILHSVKGDIVGLDVVEVNPDRDPLGITAAAAVKIILEVIGKIAVSRRTNETP